MKKKLNFKTMLATVGLLAIAVPASLSVVACGPKVSEKEEGKIALSKVLVNTEVASDITRANVVDAVLALNPGSGVSASDLEVLSFEAARIGQEGSAELGAVATSDFVGQVTIKVAAKDKIALDGVLVNRTVAGDDANDKEAVLAKVLALNADSGVSSSDVELQDFKAATTNADGSAQVVAKADSDFAGAVKITISKIVKKDLGEVLVNTEVASDITRANVVDAVLALNPSSGVSASDLEVLSFEAAGIDQEGSAELGAVTGSDFNGKVTIKIIEISKDVVRKITAYSTNIKWEELESNLTVSFLKEILTEKIQNHLGNIFDKKLFTIKFIYINGSLKDLTDNMLLDFYNNKSTFDIKVWFGYGNKLVSSTLHSVGSIETTN